MMTGYEPTARDCVCPAPDGRSELCTDRCPACADDGTDCWAALIAHIVDGCEAETHTTGDMLIVHGVREQRRLVIYSPTKRLWVTFAAPPSPREPVPALDGEHPETLDDARWIAASWIATLPRENA